MRVSREHQVTPSTFSPLAKGKKQKDLLLSLSKNAEKPITADQVRKNRQILGKKRDLPDEVLRILESVKDLAAAPFLLAAMRGDQVPKKGSLLPIAQVAGSLFLGLTPRRHS